MFPSVSWPCFWQGDSGRRAEMGMKKYQAAHVQSGSTPKSEIKIEVPKSHIRACKELLLCRSLHPQWNMTQIRHDFVVCKVTQQKWSCRVIHSINSNGSVWLQLFGMFLKKKEWPSHRSSTLNTKFHCFRRVWEGVMAISSLLMSNIYFLLLEILMKLKTLQNWFHFVWI